MILHYNDQNRSLFIYFYGMKNEELQSFSLICILQQFL